jgi:4-aminobutyrate aminotransferase
MGSVTFTSSKAMYHRGFFPLMPGVTHVPYPDPYRPVLESKPGEDYGETVIRYIEEQIFTRTVPAESVAGILVEPIQGEGGYVVPAPGFFPALRKLCDKYGILLIADEVQSGMGRTGKWWAIENWDIEPDIVCIAKGVASGMPLGVTLARQHVMSWTRGAHGNTYGGNPISCAAALATIDLIENGYMQNSLEVGEYIMDALEEIKVRHPSIGQVRGRGLMIGVDFVTDHESRTPADTLRNHIVETAFEHGLLTLGCSKSTIRIAPPLCLTRSEADEALEILETAITISEQKEHLVAT